jgi:Beta-propeller repeat
MRSIAAVALGFLLIVLADPSLAQAPEHFWSEGFGGFSSDFGTGIAVDAAGNVVVVGYFSQAMSLGGATLVSDSGSNDIFVAKYDASGTHLWSQRFGGPGDDKALAVAVDGSGNILVTGYFNGTVNFGGGNLVSGGGSQDIFLAKYNASGAHQWSQRFGSNFNVETGRGIAVDTSGNICLTGTCTGTVNFGGGNLVGGGNTDIFVAKFDASGVHQWSRSAGDSSFQDGRGIAVDGSGNVVVTGSFGGTVNLGGGNLVSAGGDDIFLVKYNASGVHQWSRRFGDYATDSGNGVAVDGSGNVIVTGSFEQSVDFGGGILSNPGFPDIFLAKYNANGVHQWSKKFGGYQSNDGLGVAVDGSANIVLTGYFTSTTPANFGGADLVSAGFRDIFIAKYNSNGTHKYSQRFGSTLDDMGFAIAAGASGRVVITGSFQGNVDFGGGVISGSGAEDIFIAKYGPKPDISHITDIQIDNGIHVKLGFFASSHDGPVGDFPVLRYEAFRQNVSPAGPPWVSVGTIPATMLSEYDMVATTDADSTCASGQHWSYFFVRAETSDPAVFFDSPIDSGYSVDNLAPGIPTNLTFTSGHLTWDPSSAPDLDHYSIYGSGTNNFASATYITDTAQTNWPVALPLYSYYFVTATDHSCNEGSAASVGTVTGVRDTPALTELQVLPNHPNPFNSSTQLNIGLPKASDVRVDVYDVAGRRVSTIMERSVPAGWRQIPFASHDDRGAPLASGVYFYRVHAAGTAITRRMVITH